MPSTPPGKQPIQNQQKAAPASILFFIAINAFGQNCINNVKIFGATGNGQTSDTKAINTAIDSAANAGGGRVYFPAGNYLSGSIHLRSSISLYLEQGATLIATDQN